MKGLKGLTRFSIMSFTTSKAKEVSHEGLDSSDLLRSVNGQSLLLSLLHCHHSSSLCMFCVSDKHVRFSYSLLSNFLGQQRI